MQSTDPMSLAIQNRREERPLRATISCWTGAFLLLLISALPAHAQFGASLAGTVLDQSGASIPRATVTLTNAATQETQTSTTNDTGAYHFSELAPGQYSLVVTAAGFKTNNVTNLALEAETPRNVNITLQPGGATESVQVNGDLVPLLQTADASIGTTIDSKEIQRLPTIGSAPMNSCALRPASPAPAPAAARAKPSFFPMAPAPAAPTPGSFRPRMRFRLPRPASARPTTTLWWTA